MVRVVWIGSEKQELSLELKSMYEAYFKSKEFELALLNVLKLDEIYGKSPTILEVFTKIFDWENLENNEFSLVKRVFLDSYFMESLSQTLSDEDFEMFFSYIKKTNSNLVLANWFYYPSSSFKKENKIVVITYIVWEFLWAIKNSYVSNLINQTTTQVEWIIWEYAGEEIEIIKQAKKYSVIKIWEEYKLYDNETKKILSEYLLLNKEILTLKNGDFVMIITSRRDIFEQYAISLETWEQITPSFQISYDIEKYPTQTVIFIRTNSTLEKKPYSLETKDFLNPEVFPVPEKKDFLSMDEVDALLKWVTGEPGGKELAFPDEDEWARAIAEMQQDWPDIKIFETPILDEIERWLNFKRLDEMCNWQAKPEDIKN